MQIKKQKWRLIIFDCGEYGYKWNICKKGQCSYAGLPFYPTWQKAYNAGVRFRLELAISVDVETAKKERKETK